MLRCSTDKKRLQLVLLIFLCSIRASRSFDASDRLAYDSVYDVTKEDGAMPGVAPDEPSNGVDAKYWIEDNERGEARYADSSEEDGSSLSDETLKEKASRDDNSPQKETASLIPGTEERSLKLPDVTIDSDDTHLCTGIPLNRSDPLFIIRFVPHAISSVAHHMIVYACLEPGARQPVWKCGGNMDTSGSKGTELVKRPICKSGKVILWAWAKDAPEFNLPKDVGFKVGYGTKRLYLVLDVHFKLARTANENNAIAKTSVVVTTTSSPQPKLAQILFSGSGFNIVPPHSTRNFDIACRYNKRVTIHPFAFRVHTHALGTEVASYRIRRDQWTLIGKMDPQKPQMFYPVKNPNIDIKQGDWLASRCVMVNKGNRLVRIGGSHKDEMCNFYLMYWVPEGQDGDLPEGCWSGMFEDPWKSLPSPKPMIAK